MPVFDQKEGDAMQTYTMKGMSFSAVRPAQLGATEYTLVGLTVDESGSVYSFESALVGAIKEAVKSCGYSPRANNLLIRTNYFNDYVREIHGFKELRMIDADKDYSMIPSGYTALFDASIDMVKAIGAYAEVLRDNDFDCNAILIVITDGEDNRSKVGSNSVGIMAVKEAIDKLKADEKVESLVTILVAVNAQQCKKALEEFSTKVGFDAFIPIDEYDYKKAAKLAQFVSKSISSQSQSLGTGGPSQVLDF